MPRGLRALITAAVVVLVLGGSLAWLVQGPAILMELGTGVARILCL